MEKIEMRYLAGLIKKAAEFLSINTGKKTVIRNTKVTPRSYYEGIARTPADSALLRMNSQPWS